MRRPARLEEVEERLALLERLKRKHGPTLDDVIARRDALAAEHAALTGGDRRRRRSRRRSPRRRRRSSTAARALSRRRRGRGDTFARALETRARRAGDGAHALRGAARHQRRRRSRWSERGIDAGEFYLSPNLGEDLRPLARIVSGGELSRVMLALKTLGRGRPPRQDADLRRGRRRHRRPGRDGGGREAAARSASGSRSSASPTSRRSPPPGRRTSTSRRAVRGEPRPSPRSPAARTSESRNGPDDGGA